jgi:hypothetical protein
MAMRNPVCENQMNLKPPDARLQPKTARRAMQMLPAWSACALQLVTKAAIW